VKTIWKFPFEIKDHVEIEMPKGAKPLCVKTQGDSLANLIYRRSCLWCLVDPDNPKVTRSFELRGTGHTFDGSEGDYIGTLHMAEDQLVYHLFTSKEE